MIPIVVALLAVHIAPGGTGLEYRQPQLAANANMVAVTFGAGNAIYFATSRDQGRTLSEPVKVAEGAPMLGSPGIADRASRSRRGAS